MVLSFLGLSTFCRTCRKSSRRYWQYPHYGNQGGAHSHEELYNLKEDIGETRNLADSEPEKREELSAQLTAWSEEIEGLGAPLVPEPNPD